jgi:hypothetical protein
MSDHIRDRIARRLAALPEERLYQVLDYVEFLESRYAARSAPDSLLQRFADGVEDTLRTGGLAAGTVAEAMGFLNRAVGVLNDVAARGAAVASDVVGATPHPAGPPVAEAGSPPPPPAGPAAPPPPPPPRPAPGTRPTDYPDAGSTI